METNCTYLDYKQTHSFTPIVYNYIQQSENLRQFYSHTVSIEGIQAAIAQRKSTDINRQVLVNELKEQYKNLSLSSLQEKHLNQLSDSNTFTICTAHQPNVFTGHLYFIYKILHAIKLADALQQQLPQYHFVPVFYMGSEDADLDELGHIIIDGKEYKWQTNQTGAVGRMKVDKAFLQLVNEMEGQLTIHPFGGAIIQLFRQCYKAGITIQQATLQLVHELFKEYGLLVLIPDNSAFKKEFTAVVKKELAEGFSYPLVQEASERLSLHYKIQAGGRPVNLFYLINDKRERIEKQGENFVVRALDKKWTQEEIFREAEDHPERFSANVILRAVFQEIIMPNVAFIGGGGEIAYWLELKKVFDAVNVPFPMLVLRNSFMLVNDRQVLQANKLGFEITEIFASTNEMMNKLVAKMNGVKLSLTAEIETLHHLYAQVQSASSQIDATLNDHVLALQQRHVKQWEELEKKMLRAEKRKYNDQQRQLEKLKNQLFPNGALQERVDNFSGYYARYGKDWLHKIYDASLTLEQKFCVLSLASPA